MQYRLLALFFASLWIPASYASSFSEDKLETISVVGARSPVPQQHILGQRSYLSHQDIVASGATMLLDLLRTLPGVNISQSGGLGSVAQLRLRGSEADHLLVLIDGVAVNDASQGGTFDFGLLSVANIASVELLSGAQSARWGSGALAGVLAITTLNGQGMHLTASVGSQQLRQAGLRGGQHNDKLQLNFSVNHLASDGHNIAPAGTERDGFSQQQAQLRLRWDATAQQRIAALWRSQLSNSEFDAIDFANTGLPLDADNHSRHRHHSGELSWQFSPGTRWQHEWAIQYNRHLSRHAESNEFSGQSESSHLLSYWQSDLSYAQDSRLTMVFERNWQRFSQTGPIVFGDPNQRQRMHTSALIADWQHALTDNLGLSASMRHERSNAFSHANSGTLGLSYEFAGRWRGFISLAKGVKHPSFTERYGYFPGQFSGNPALKPEHSLGWQLGASYQGDIQLDWSLYSNKLHDEIEGLVFDPQLGEFGGFTAANRQGQSRRRGVDMAAQWYWGEWRWDLSYALVDSQDDSGQKQLRRPRHSGSVRLQGPLAKGELHLQYSLIGKRTDRFYPPWPRQPERITLGSYGLIQLGFTRPLSADWRWQLSISNAANKQYQDVYGFNTPGRQVRVRLEGNF